MTENIIVTVNFSIRILLSIIALLILARCFISMRKNIRGNNPLILLFNSLTKDEMPVLSWENSIGRSKNSDIVLNDPSVSREHAVLLRRENGWMITDTNSKSGVYVNGEKISGREQVFINDTITLGSTPLIVKKVNKNKLNKSLNGKKTKYKYYSQSFMLFLVTIFQVLEAISLSIANGKFNYYPLIPIGILIVISWLFFIISKYILNRVNFEIETLAIFLCSIGVGIISGVEGEPILTQLVCIALGMILFTLIIQFIEDPDRVMKWRLIISAFAILLFIVNLLIGTVQNGAKNWITIGPLSIQPSEIIKIAFIFVGASTLDKLQTGKNLTEFIAFSAICIGALFLMGDFGTACIFFVTFLIISFMRSGDIRTIILICAAAILGAFMILKFKPYVANRFSAWGHVWDYSDSLGFQQTRVLTYSASGGLFGMGLGQGDLKYIFASTSDLVFGMVCEELGLIVAAIATLTICSFAIYSRKASAKSRSTFYYIAACSSAGLLLFQTSLNIFGATDVLPLTGVTLPFISMGGSSMISVWGLLAFIKVADERTYAARRNHT